MRILSILIASAFCLTALSSAVRAEREDGPSESPERSKPTRSTSQPKQVKTPPGKPGSTPATPTATIPPAATPAAVTRLSAEGEGRRAYLKFNCYGCHGMGATGGMGPNIVGAESGDVSEAVLQGKDEGMPSYRRIATSADVNNLAAYLRSIGTAREPKFNDWWVTIPRK